MKNTARGVIRFNATKQQAIVPNVLTMAGVLDAVPLESVPAGAKVVFAALTEWRNATALYATRWVFERYANATTTMAKGNP